MESNERKNWLVGKKKNREQFQFISNAIDRVSNGHSMVISMFERAAGLLPNRNVIVFGCVFVCVAILKEKMCLDLVLV